jgi:hypothetical protein
VGWWDNSKETQLGCSESVIERGRGEDVEDFVLRDFPGWGEAGK